MNKSLKVNKQINVGPIQMNLSYYSSDLRNIVKSEDVMSQLIAMFKEAIIDSYNSIEQDGNVFNLPIEELKIPVNVRNILKKQGYKTIGNIPLSELQLRSIPGLGRKSFLHIKGSLKDKGIGLT